MDDDTCESGLSGWAGYQLGRMSAESDARDRQTADLLFNRRPVVYIDPVRDENHSLRQQVQNLRAAEHNLVQRNQDLARQNKSQQGDLNDYKYNYDRLKEWA